MGKIKTLGQKRCNPEFLLFAIRNLYRGGDEGKYRNYQKVNFW